MDLHAHLAGDASSLIYNAKADCFAEIRACVARIEVPPAVWREAVDERERIGAVEVPRIRTAPGIRRVELDEPERAMADVIAASFRLGAGESEVLALGRRVGRAIVDEGRAARVARSLGIVPISTLFLPVLGRRSGALTAKESVLLVRRLAVVAGARAEVVLEIEGEIRKDAK